MAILFFILWKGGIESVKRAYDALLLDAGGTLLQLVVPVEETYASIGSKYGYFFNFISNNVLMGYYLAEWSVILCVCVWYSLGLTITPSEIKKGFKRAFAASWPEKLRYQVVFDSLCFAPSLLFLRWILSDTCKKYRFLRYWLTNLF